MEVAGCEGVESEEGRRGEAGDEAGTDEAVSCVTG